MTLADAGAAAVAFVLAVVPTAIVLLALHALATRLDLAARLGRNALRVLAAVTGAVLASAAVLLTWAFAGANYLKPRCNAFAAPEYALAGDDRATPVATAGLRLDLTGPPPDWAAALLGPGGFAFYEWREPGGRLRRVGREDAARPAGGALDGGTPPRVDLRMRTSTARVNAWVTLGTDRFTLRDRLTGARLATADEMWVDAGPARYRCGVGSGPAPVRAREYAEPRRLLAFVVAAARPAAP